MNEKEVDIEEIPYLKTSVTALLIMIEGIYEQARSNATYYGELENEIKVICKRIKDVNYNYGALVEGNLNKRLENERGGFVLCKTRDTEEIEKAFAEQREFIKSQSDEDKLSIQSEFTRASVKLHTLMGWTIGFLLVLLVAQGFLIRVVVKLAIQLYQI